MSNSDWRVIPGFSRYSASADGQVRRDAQIYRTKPGLVSQRIDKHGYWSCSLTDDDGVQKKKQTHKFIAMAFFGNPAAGEVVCHGPAGKLNNCVSNLRYDSPAENVEDMRRHGTMALGSKHPGSKLNEAKVSEILSLLCTSGFTHKEIGKLFQVDGACIGRIATGEKWKHVPRPKGFEEFRAAKAAKRGPVIDLGRYAAAYGGTVG